MSWRTKVVWSEGMLLQPQHLQQSERHADHARHLLLRATRPCAWGFTELEIDSTALALGKLALTRAVGVFGDGTPFDMPAVDPLPEAIDIEPGLRDERIVLALPLRRAGAREADAEGEDELVRHKVLEAEVPDSNTAGDRSAVLQLGRLHTRLMRERDATDAWTTLRTARVVERRADNQVLLDRQLVPPLLDVAAHGQTRTWLEEILGLLRQRGDELAGSLTAGGTGGVAEIADFLMLQAVNRNEALFAHLHQSPTLHPLHFYEEALQLAGELVSFRDTRRTTRFGPYQHDDLAASFKPLMDDLRRSFSMVIDRAAVRIDLQDRKNRLHVAVLKDPELLRKASFVLAATAQMPGESLRARFPTQLTIGPVERIRDLVTLALPGVPLTPMQVAPRQIPFHAGASYFELETRNNDLWRQLEQSGGIAMYVAGEFPGLELSFWAIKP